MLAMHAQSSRRLCCLCCCPCVRLRVNCFRAKACWEPAPNPEDAEALCKTLLFLAPKMPKLRMGGADSMAMEAAATMETQQQRGGHTATWSASDLVD